MKYLQFPLTSLEVEDTFYFVGRDMLVGEYL